MREFLVIRFEQGRGRRGVPLQYTPLLREADTVDNVCRQTVLVLREQTISFHGKDLMPVGEYSLHRIGAGFMAYAGTAQVQDWGDLLWRAPYDREVEEPALAIGRDDRCSDLVLVWEVPARHLLERVAA